MSDIKALVAEKVQAVKANDWFALLGVAVAASKPELQKAYFDLAKRLHPDKLSNIDLGEHTEAGLRLFSDLSEAYNTLVDPARRQTYLRDNPPKEPMRGGTGPVSGGPQPGPDLSRSTQELLAMRPDEPGVNHKEAAKIFYHKGMMAMKKGAFSDAERLLKRALDGDPESPRYALQLGWAIFQNPSRTEKARQVESKRYLSAAVEQAPTNPEAHYFLARWFKATGDMKGCKKHLKTALEHRDNYIEAKRELRLLDMRAKKQSGARTRPAPGGKGKKRGASKANDPNRPGRWPFGLDRLFKKK